MSSPHVSYRFVVWQTWWQPSDDGKRDVEMAYPETFDHRPDAESFRTATIDKARRAMPLGRRDLVVHPTIIQRRWDHGPWQGFGTVDGEFAVHVAGTDPAGPPPELVPSVPPPL